MLNPAPKSMKTSVLTEIALLAAVNMLFLFGARYLALADMFFLTLASLGLAFLILRRGVKAAMFCFVITSLLALFLIGLDIFVPYFLFFGFYPFVKLACEKHFVKNHNAFIGQSLCKIAYFILHLGVIRLLMKTLLPGLSPLFQFEFLMFSNDFWRYIVAGIVLLLMFIVYDFCFSIILKRISRLKI